jgi:hypothetical protein
MFALNKDENNQQYCDINKTFKLEYLIGNIIFVFFIMLIPMLIILISNFIIIQNLNVHLLARLILYKESFKTLKPLINLVKWHHNE